MSDEQESDDLGDGGEVPDFAVEQESKQQESYEDQRAAARVNLERAILIRLSSGDTVKATLVNLSCGGIAIHYPAPAENGAKLGLVFQLPDDKGELVTIQTEGIVRHTHIKGQMFVIGIEFFQLAEQSMDFIEQFVKRKLSNSANSGGYVVSHRHR